MDVSPKDPRSPGCRNHWFASLQEAAVTASIAPRQRLTCRQPGCPMKVHGYTADDLADLFVRFMAGEPRDELTPDANGYSVGENCRSCACNVMHGYPTYHTEAEWQHLDELGRRYYWRHRHGRDRKGASLTFFNFG